MPRYIPEPVPDFEDDTQELRRYLNQELHRISSSVNQKTDRAYGGIFQGPGTFIFTPLTPTPELFTAFDFITPETPDGVFPSILLASLAMLSGGAYQVNFTTTVIAIPPNAEYGFLLALNGASTGIGGTIEPSNQTEIATVAFTFLFNATKGDIFTMLINSPTSTAAEVTGSEFSATRVSEEQ